MYKTHFEDGGEIGDYLLTQRKILPSWTPSIEDLATELSYESAGDRSLRDSYEAGLLLATIPNDNLRAVADAYIEQNPQLSPEERADVIAFVTNIDDPEMRKLLRQQELTQSGQNAVANLGPQGDTKTPSISLDGDSSSKLSASDLLKYGLPALGSYLSYKSAKDAQKEAKGVSLGKNAPVTATKVSGKGVRYSAMGGLQSLAQGGKSSLPPRYLDGHTDGMADKVPAHIDNRRPAALSDGEFVVPADVVSHLGNGNSTAGAKRLYEMMDRIRAARTGTTKQGKQINPDKFLPR